MSTQLDRASTEVQNICAGRFGAVYDYYIERPWLARVLLGLMWGVDSRPFYRSIAAVGEAPDGATILDVPCGGGVALRGLRSGQRVSWIGVDSAPAMLSRTPRRAARFPSVQTRLIEGDMAALPLEDRTAETLVEMAGVVAVIWQQAEVAAIALFIHSG